ncbi:MAG: 4Fe-4S dicluster domain-containing protein [Deltaproteobacteria bacterium]|nr:4Fe-4S dicluster domain-containing protein [Deltaproteobacteria bacterium]
MIDEFIGFFRRVFAHGENPFSRDYIHNRMRPPGAAPEQSFMALCIRCNRCLEVCPFGSITRAGLGPTIGTPYVLAERKACYLCMACTRLCPTNALESSLRNPEQARMGKAVINTSICYSHLFADRDALPRDAGARIGALCNTCYNVCPLQDKAIMLQGNLFPIVLDECVGCGICVERCPTRPKRAINVVPTGMGRPDESGFYFRKARKHFDVSRKTVAGDQSGVLKGDDLMDAKERIDGSGGAPKFTFPYEVDKGLKDWE